MFMNEWPYDAAASDVDAMRVALRRCACEGGGDFLGTDGLLMPQFMDEL